MKITAIYLFNNFADCRGLISKKILDQYNWTIEQAEKEGLVIKEKYKLSYIVTSEKKHRKAVKKCEI